jgi:hypothetical protein
LWEVAKPCARGKNTRGEIETFPDGTLNEKAAIRKVAIARSRADDIPAVPIEAAGTNLLVSPERRLVPSAPHTQAVAGIARGKLEYATAAGAGQPS